MSTAIPITRSARQIVLDALPGQTVFTYPGAEQGPVWDAADIVIERKTAGDTAWSPVSSGVTVSLVNDGMDGATATFAAAPRPAVGDPAVQIRLTSRRVDERSTDLSRAGRIHAPSMERDFDIKTTVAQEQRRDIAGSYSAVDDLRQELHDAVLGQVPDGVWTNDKLADVPAGTLKGRPPGFGTGSPQDLTLDPDTTLHAADDSRVATQRAVKTYTDDHLATIGATVDGLGATVADLQVGFSAGVRAPLTPVALSTAANIALSGEQTIDGVLTAASDVLVRAQTNPAQNGIYTTGAGAWTRRADADTGDELYLRSVLVLAGTARAGTSWRCANTAAPAIGTDPVTWVQVSISDTVSVATQTEVTAARQGAASLTQRLSQINTSALPNLIQNGNLADGGRAVRFFAPHGGGDSTVYKSSVEPPGHAYLADRGCNYALTVLASAGGRGNRIMQDVTLRGGNLLVSSFVRTSVSGNFNFGGNDGLVAIARYSDGTSASLTSGAGTLQSDGLSVVRRYYGSISLDPAKTCVRLEMGLDDPGTRTADFYLSGFWSSCSAAAAPTLDQTLYPAWDASPDPTPIRRSIDDLASRLDRGLDLDALKRALADPLQSIELALLGDSITWGLGASGNGPNTPRAHALTDTRDVLTSKSWANKLGEWLGFRVCGGENFANPAPGVREYRQSQLISPVWSEGVTTYFPGGERRRKESGAASGGKLYRFLLLQPSDYLEFDFYGADLTLWYSALNSNPAHEISVYVDGVLHGTQSAYASPAVYSRDYSLSLSLGWHRIRLVNSNHAQLRFEAVEHSRICRILNQGLIGTNAGEWLPGGSLLAGAVPSTATHALLQLGTNDRGSTTFPRDAVRLYQDLISIIDWLAINRPGLKVCLMAPPHAQSNAEEGGTGGGTYYFKASEVARAVSQVAVARALPFRDNYATTRLREINGEACFSDGLHLNDAGNAAVFQSLVEMLS